MSDILDEVEDFGKELAESNKEQYAKFEPLFEHMADATAFGEALNTLFLENGLLEADAANPNANFSMLENIVDAVFLELFAGVFFLSTLDNVGPALRAVGDQLGKQESVPPAVAAGYMHLADRVEATAEARNKLEAKMAEEAAVSDDHTQVVDNT